MACRSSFLPGEISFAKESKTQPIFLPVSISSRRTLTLKKWEISIFSFARKWNLFSDDYNSEHHYFRIFFLSLK